MTFLIAPTERPPISTLGTSSALPERLGADILFESKHGLVGVQRKEQADLIASVRDGRLGREFQLMQQLQLRFLVIEGSPQWDREGNLMTARTPWTLRQQWGVELSAQTHGVMVVKTRSAMETVACCEYLATWAEKDEHVSSLLARPKPPTNGWGKPDDKLTFQHIFSSLPSVSMELSGRIFDKFGNVIRLGVTEDELKTVDGIGPKRAKAIVSCFPASEGPRGEERIP